MDSLGEKIRVLRKERRMTQQELAKGLVTPSMISQIESNKATPSRQLLHQIAGRLGVKLAYFADDIDQKTDLSQTYRRARTLIETENFAAAVPLLLTLVEHPTPQFREESLYGDLAHCYERLGQLPEACQMYENVARTALARSDVPAAVYAYFHLGQVYRRRQEPALARMYWQRASLLLRRYPSLDMPLAVKIHANLGRIHYQLKEYSWALQSYRRAAHQAEKNSSTLDLAMIYHGLGTVHMELSQHEAADKALRTGLQLYETIRHQRGINQCKINIGVNYRLAGQLEAAVMQLSTCLEHRELLSDSIRLANALSELAICHLERGQLSEAEQSATQAMGLDKDTDSLQATLRQTLARIELKRGDTDRALQWIDAALPLAERAGSVKQLAELLDAKRTTSHSPNETRPHGEVVQQLLALASNSIFPQK